MITPEERLLARIIVLATPSLMKFDDESARLQAIRILATEALHEIEDRDMAVAS